MVTATVRKLVTKSAILFGICLLIFLFGLSENLVLKYYSNGLYPIIAICLRWISSLFPFALGDILYTALGLYILFRLIFFLKRIKQKKLVKADRIRIPLQMLHVIMVLYILFKILWGLNYSRPSISRQLNIENQKYTVKQLVTLGNFFIGRLNELQLKVNNKQTYTLSTLTAQAKTSYHMMEQINPFFRYQVTSVKPVLNDWIVSKIGIEGYYNPLSGEANVNGKLLPWVLPFVTCHEIAHQIGVAREDEANLVAYLVGINSKDINFQYSVNYTMLRYILFEIRFKSPDDYLAMRDRLDPAIIANFKAENLFWRKYNGQMSNYMGMAFDKFLKLNNQKRGLKSYQNIVIWLFNYHRKELSN
jgi:hypothetical protein